MRELTKAEEEIMQLLWGLKRAFVKDLVNKMTNPKPAYNTVSTIVRILEQKGFVGHDEVGKSHQYFPLVSKEQYSSKFIKGFVSRFFSGSYPEMISLFAREKDMSVDELEQVLEHLKKSTTT